MSAIVPVPRVNVAIRQATIEDLAFVDSLQKVHRKQVGWMPTKALVGKISAGQVIVAEELFEVGCLKLDETSNPQTLKPQTTNSVGYCIGQDQYFKRDDVGI